MAKAKPKPLQVVTPCYRPRRNAPRKFDNGMQPPARLNQGERAAWDSVIKTLPWLTHSDLPTALAWCRLWVSFLAEKNPSAAQYERLARLGSALGLSPLARARLGVDDRRAQLRAVPPLSKATKYFEGDDVA
jgi:hypothetical protein